MLRDIIRKTWRSFRERAAGHVEMQKLLDLKHIQVSQTRKYVSDDEDRLKDPGANFDIKPCGPPGEVTCWSYRFTFDNESRKRRFLKALEEYPEQEWDSWVKWLNDFSNYEGEYCVEAMCRIPTDEVGRFSHKFKEFYSSKLIVKD